MVRSIERLYRLVMPIIILDLGTEFEGESQIPNYTGKIIAFRFLYDLQRDLDNDGGWGYDFVLTRIPDKVTPKLCARCTNGGDPIPRAQMNMFRVSTVGGGLEKHVTVDLRNVHITGVWTETEVRIHPQTGEMIERVLEHVGISYDAIHWWCDGVVASCDFTNQGEWNPNA